MKRKISLLLALYLIISISACGVSQEDYDAIATEKHSTQKQLESESSENEFLNETPDEFFSRVESEYEENETESATITSGAFYDSISEIYSDILLIDLGEDVSISIFVLHENELEDSILFFDVVNQIIQADILTDYSGITFMMFVDKSLTAMFTVMDYTSPSSFVSSDPVIMKSEYKENIDTIYSFGFSSSDISNTFDKKLDELRKKYNLDN